ncbi:MAG: NAD(P)/FAD-dependent oxidoreductase [Oligoflexus sp.]
MTRKKLIVVGGGAAGFFGAIAAAEACPAAEVQILEATARPLTKVKISGGGRCNVTHQCFDVKKLVEFYPRGRRELLSIFSRFQPQDTIDWFAARGVNLKAEADGRMFPTTNKSETIINCLQQSAEKAGVLLRKGALVAELRRSSSERGERAFLLKLKSGEVLDADAVLWTTGSVPRSYSLIEGVGHHIVPAVPSLFTFEVKHPLLEEMAGQSFAQVHLRLSLAGKKFQQIGPMLITHWGLSGPAVLKLSAFASRELCEQQYQADLSVNFLYPAKEEDLVQSLSLHKQDSAQKPLSAFSPLPMSKRFWQRCLEHFGISSTQTWSQLATRDLRKIVQGLSHVSMRVEGKGVFKEEFVSCGGVNLKEVDFKTMESKLCPGLYFAGEVLNIDGITGGFNFQNAWSGSWVAAQAIAKRLAQD